MAPAPSAALNDAARALISSANLAHVVTLNKDGSPQVSCVWVGFDTVTDAGIPDEICFASLGEYQKIKNLRRDPRITVSIETGEEPNEYGLIPYLVINGTARITEGHGPAMLQHLAHTYLGPDTTYPPMPDPPEGFVVRITPTKVSGVGNWSA